MASLREFSKMAGVSTATVSRVFSKPDTVAPDTRDRLLKLADRMGFRPSAVGRVAFGGRTRSVGVLLPSLTVSHFAQIAMGLQNRFLEDDHLPMILQHDGIDAQRAVRRLVDHKVDAMILNLIHEGFTSHDFEDVIKSGLPVVTLDMVRAGLPYDSVASDDLMGGRLVAEHLLDLGHRHFGFVYFGAGHSSADVRLQGFRQAISERGVALTDQQIVRLDSQYEDREQRLVADLIHMLQRPDRPTAIFASTDYLALSVYEAARSLKIKIPRDLSVIGYANLNFSTSIDPPLTSVSQNGYQIGTEAARLVLKRLEHPKGQSINVLIPTALVLRHSTAPPRHVSQ
jgi:DNA-binding LacI/PurR family transcriptional regulator